MAEYINRDTFLEQQRAWYCKDCNRRKNSKGKTVYEIGEAPCRACDIGTILDAVEDYPAAGVVERKTMAEDVEELIGMMRDYAKECASGDDVCASCQFSYFCEDGWTPDAISDKLVELANQATERKTGTWCADYDYAEYDFDGSTPLPEPRKFQDGWQCSLCGGYSPSETNYCPNCGAEMEG